MQKIDIFYLDICPLDRGGAYFEEIYNYGFHKKDFDKFKKSLFELKEDENIDIEKLNNFKEDYLLYQKLKKFINFFREKTGHNPLKLQLYWAKRALKKESFSIIAPTGIGKTTFGNVLAHFIQGKVYYLVPSKILLKEIENKLKEINSNKKILVIKQPEDKDFLKSEDFDILITTSNFLHRNFEIIPKNFDLVFIDDADSLIRQPKNIDKILKLIGFNDEEINFALEIIDKKRKAKNADDYKNIESLNIDLSRKGIIIAASATLTPKTKRIALFRELLNFEIGSATTYLRNIEETYELVNEKEIFERSVYWLKKIGPGGFVFLSDDFDKEDLEKYVKFLNKNNIPALSYEKFNNKNKNAFLKDEVYVFVGFSNVRNPLTRGIDLPQKVKYALFLGVPKFKIPLKVSYSPLHLFLLGLSLREILEEKEKNLIEKNLNFLKKISFLKEEQVLNDENLKKRLEPIKEIYEKLLQNQNLTKKIEEHPELTLKKINDMMYLIVSDPRGYLQASGRTSRIFPLGLTKGFSLILAENIKVLKHLEDKLKILGYEAKFKNINEINLQDIFEKIDSDREIVKKVLEGKEYSFKDPIKTILVIVESPTKAKTIANFFGKPARRIKDGIIFYEVSLGNLHLNIVATLGHFVDLVHKEGYYGVKKEDGKFIPIFQPFKICQNCQRHLDFDENECPVCKSKNFITKNKLIENLRKIASEVDEIYLTTDPDTEGEKIAFDLFAYLYPYSQNIKRIELHEITRTEFIRRIQKPREIDINLVKAQLLRRISDRWIGFKLSEKMQQHFKNLNLSAGRVQSPVLGWILEKEKRIKEKHYLISLSFNNQIFSFTSEDKNFIESIKEKFKNNELEIEINIRNKKEEVFYPLPPYDTSNLLKDANNFFKFTAETTMKLAQDLFEQGFITYHRTDSIFISEFGRNLAYEYLEKKNLINLIYKRSWGEVGTHEGIRPTKPLDVQDIIESLILEPRNLTKKHLQLYGLIFNRFISSQMKPAKAIKAKIKIKIKDFIKEDEGIIEIIEENHLKFFKNIRLNNLKEGKFKIEDLKVKKISKEFHYSQGELIDLMKKRGLGRPSTYSNIIQTLIERRYVLNRSGYLILTPLGEKIYNYLKQNYQELIDENFTKTLEENMDLISKGKEIYTKTLKETFKSVFD